MTNEATPTFYEVLGVASHASDAEIRHAYRSIARRFHPDAPDAPADADELMSVLNEAHDTLRDPMQRRAYDATLAGSQHFRHESLDDSYQYLPPDEPPAPSSPLSAVMAVLFALGIINLGLGFATSSAGPMTFGVMFLFGAAVLAGIRFRQAMRPESNDTKR
jgi:curved DNA-binding protein CbpA